MAFNELSVDRMQGVDPRLIEILQITRQRTGIPFEITEGLRDSERQAELVEASKSQTMNSKHLTGNALDIHILNPDGSANWDFEAYRPIADAAKQVAAELGYNDLVWGGDWQSLRDGVHFQLGGQYAQAAPPAVPAPPSAPPFNPGYPDERLNRLSLQSNMLDAGDFMMSAPARNKLAYS